MNSENKECVDRGRRGAHVSGIDRALALRPAPDDARPARHRPDTGPAPAAALHRSVHTPLYVIRFVYHYSIPLFLKRGN